VIVQSLDLARIITTAVVAVVVAVVVVAVSAVVEVVAVAVVIVIDATNQVILHVIVPNRIHVMHQLAAVQVIKVVTEVNRIRFKE